MTDMPNPEPAAAYDAVLFDLLTALIDSWTLWNDVAGSPEAGMKWRRAYLGVTYGCGAYRPYETLVAEAAALADIAPDKPGALTERWGELQAWPEVSGMLGGLKGRVKLGVVTNCSITMGRAAANAVFPGFDVVTTAEEAGFYKPDRAPYALALKALGTEPERTLFVAGSASDVPGASALGMPVYWHNRIGAPAIGDVTPKYHEASLDGLSTLI